MAYSKFVNNILFGILQPQALVYHFEELKQQLKDIEGVIYYIQLKLEVN